MLRLSNVFHFNHGHSSLYAFTKSVRLFSSPQSASSNDVKNTSKPPKVDQKFKSKSQSSYFKPRNYKPNTDVDKPQTNKFFKQIKPIKTCKKLLNFDELGLLPSVFEGLKKHLINKHLSKNTELKQNEALNPFSTTEVQTLLIPEALKRIHNPNPTGYKAPIVCGAETGSGKTLAYLIPIIQTIKLEEINFIHKNKVSTTNLKNDSVSTNKTFVNFVLNSPKSVILAPSCELVDQIYDVAKDLSHLIKYRVAKLNRNTKSKDFKNRTKNLPLDVLVCTPTSLINVINNNPGYLDFKNLKVMVIDEADTLFDNKFKNETQSIMNLVEKESTKCQVIITTATIPKETYDIINSRYSDVLYLSTKKLHKIKEHSEHMFIDLKHYQGNRNLALLDTLRQYETRLKAKNTLENTTMESMDKIIIFCNTQTAVMNLTQYLNYRKINCLALYSGILKDDRIEDSIKHKSLINKFIYNNTNGRVSKHAKNHSDQDKQDTVSHDLKNIKTKNEIPNILICTDLASRGLDTLEIKHVINYDFPKSKMDYLHRAGRTSRIYSKGIVTSLLGEKEREIGREIERHVRKKTAFI